MTGFRSLTFRQRELSIPCTAISRHERALVGVRAGQAHTSACSRWAASVYCLSIASLPYCLSIASLPYHGTCSRLA